MKRFLTHYILFILITIAVVYADSYQNLLITYNNQQPAESLFEQLGQNLSKRVATDAERSNTIFKKV